MTQQALAAPVQPTALCAANNLVASGAMNALQDAGLRVPEDMAQLDGSKERQEIVLPTEIVVRRSSGGPLNLRQA